MSTAKSQSPNIVINKNGTVAELLINSNFDTQVLRASFFCFFVTRD